MKRREYVVQVTQQLAENPRAVLAGHGINSAVLQQISKRPDVLAKLANFGLEMNTFKKGAKGLKKAANFKITGYKNFAEFNMKAREDVETFMAGLPGTDADTFNNATNIAVILVLPDTASGDLESEIANGKSVALRFDTSVRKEYKMPGGFYLTIMFGDSAIRSTEETIAAAKADVNEKKVEVLTKTPSKVKATFEQKAKRKLLKLKKKNAPLEHRAAKAAAAVQQVASLADALGAGNINPAGISKVIRSYNAQTKKFLAGLTGPEKIVYKEVMTLLKGGKVKDAEKLLNELGNEDLTKIVMNGNFTTAEALIAEKKKALRAEIRGLVSRSEGYLKKAEEFQAAGNARGKAQAMFDMKKVNKQIDILRARLNAYKGLKAGNVRSKLELLKATNAAIADNIAKGATVSQALNRAISQLPTDEATKQQIKQQVLQQVAQGTSTQLAVQNAIQQVPQAQLQQVVATSQQIPAEEEMPIEEVTQVIDLDEEPIEDVFGTEGVMDTLDDVVLSSNGDIRKILDIL